MKRFLTTAAVLGRWRRRPWPNKKTAVDQLPLLRAWQAYPGDNGPAITQMIYDGIEGIVAGDHDDMGELQSELTEEVEDLLN